jgi:hypothetical protein
MLNQTGKELFFVFLLSTLILQSCTHPLAQEIPSASHIPDSTNPPPTSTSTDTAEPSTQTIATLVNATDGGTIELSDGAALYIPPGALSRDTEVVLRSLTDDGPESQLPDAMINAGKIYEIDLGENELQAPVTLEIPFDPALLPSDVEPSQVFLSTFDEASGNWIYAGGTVDVNRSIITLSIAHASWWKPTSWNWTAWAGILNSALKGSIVGMIKSAQLLTAGCEQSATYTRVENLELQNLVQGCIDEDNRDRPIVRLVNPRSIYYEVLPMSGGRGYPLQTMLGPADSFTFEIDTNDPSPLIVRAMITEKSSWYLVGQMILAMLPGLNELRTVNQISVLGTQISCFTERLHDYAPILKIVDALWNRHDGAAAAEILSKFFLDAAAMRRFIKMADDCNFAQAKTWSFKGLGIMGASISTIMSATDYIATYFSGNVYGEVAFYWESPSTPTPIASATSAPTNTAEPVSSLRGTVTQQSNCRYAPSEFHLYKTGFKPQAPVKIIGRDADGDWLQIELSGGNTPCWINASLVQAEGDIMALPDQYPPDRRLPISDAFPQIALISAEPGGNGITASWVHQEIREDLKQTGTVEYIIEVWTCVDGEPAFYAVGTDDTVASFQVDNSCGISSYAHLIGQDEHGFSFPTKIPLP